MYLDPFALRAACFGVISGLLLALATFFTSETDGVFWRRAVAALFLIGGVLALVLAVTS